jgi:hypothetical protein
MSIVTTPLFPADDWTIAGNIVTFLVTPVDGDTYTASYAVAVPNDDVLHTHSYEVKSVWTGGATTWTLTDTPLDGSLQIFRAAPIPGNLWQVYSDFHATTNQTLGIAIVGGSPSALTWTWTADGPWAVPAGQTITCMAATTNEHVFLCCVNAGTQTLYRFDREDGSFNVVGQWSGAGVGTIWQVYMVSEDEMYLVFRQATVGAGVRYTLDGGATWQGPTAGFESDSDPGFIETPKGPYGIVGSAGAMTTVHSGQYFPVGGGVHPGPNDVYFALSYSGNGGVNWDRIAGTSAKFFEGQRGAIWSSGRAIIETFNSFGNTSIGGGTDGVGGGNDGSNYWAAQFYLQDKVIFVGSATARISAGGGAWGSLPGGYPAAAVQPYDVMHVPSVDPVTDYLIVPNWNAQSVKITTDYGTTWQTFTLPNWCGKAAWVGGYN